MNLVPLFEEAIEFQNYNGSVLSNGKVAVFYIGRTRLADIFNDIEGLSPAENPKVLDNLGMGPLYVNPAFDYEIIVYDAYDNEMFSVKKYLHSKGEHSTANVVVTPSENIAVSAWTIGDVQVYMPYLTGDVGKTYEGIDPIVVNNEYNRISANHIPLGVQDPLYFVEDSESACIIGCSAQTEIPSALSSKWNEASDAVIANSAQWAEGTEYEAGSFVNIDGHTINVTGVQPEGDYAYNSALSSALSSKLDVTALPQDLVHTGDLTAYQPAGNYLSAADSAKFYPMDNPSGFITGVDLTGYATTAQLDEKLDKTDSGNFYPMTGNPSGFLTAHQSLQGYATEQWVEGKGYLTGVDIPESANWNEATTVVNNNSAIWNNTTNIVSANSAQWAGSTANPQIPVTGINGIKISESGDKVVFEVSADYAVAADLTGKQDSLTFGYKDTAISSIDNSALYDNSAHARITTLAGRISNLSSNKLDSSAFSDVSGTFLTAVPDTYLQNTDLSTTDGKVTAISGIPLSAGGDVPEGVMVESGIEYNAVNEISGYNGSAIAQYGADKQWLVHDDTLVHAANSAQYALGVNISAVAQLLGVDETVLYNDFTGRPKTVGSYIDLSESPLNFTEIAIYLNGSGPTAENIANGYERVPTEQLSSTNTLEFVKEFVGVVGNTGSVHDMGCGYSGTSGTRWTKWYGYSYNVQNKNVDFTNNTHLNIWKIIGIGRKA